MHSSSNLICGESAFLARTNQGKGTIWPLMCMCVLCTGIGQNDREFTGWVLMNGILTVVVNVPSNTRYMCTFVYTHTLPHTHTPTHTHTHTMHTCTHTHTTHTHTYTHTHACRSTCTHTQLLLFTCTLHAHTYCDTHTHTQHTHTHMHPLTHPHTHTTHAHTQLCAGVQPWYVDAECHPAVRVGGTLPYPCLPYPSFHGGKTHWHSCGGPAGQRGPEVRSSPHWGAVTMLQLLLAPCVVRFRYLGEFLNNPSKKLNWELHSLSTNGLDRFRPEDDPPLYK